MRRSQNDTNRGPSNHLWLFLTISDPHERFSIRLETFTYEIIGFHSLHFTQINWNWLLINTNSKTPKVKSHKGVSWPKCKLNGRTVRKWNSFSKTTSFIFLRHLVHVWVERKSRFITQTESSFTVTWQIQTICIHVVNSSLVIARNRVKLIYRICMEWSGVFIAGYSELHGVYNNFYWSSGTLWVMIEYHWIFCLFPNKFLRM